MTKKDTLALALGTKVFCTVTAIRRWFEVTAIRPRDGYIQIDGGKAWCPPHNFTLTPAKWQQRENGHLLDS